LPQKGQVRFSHHKLFDRGVFTIQKELKVEVSEDANGTRGFDEWLLAFNGKAIKQPQRPSYSPNEDFLRWHDREAFRGPARHIAGKTRETKRTCNLKFFLILVENSS
jgi:hypothetical protein